MSSCHASRASYRSVAVAAVLTVVSACGADPTAPSSAPTAGRAILTGPSVVTLSPLPTFQENERFVADGTRHLDGSCGYRSVRRLKKGQHEAEHLVQADLVNCQFVVARGSYRAPRPVDDRAVAVDTVVARSTASSAETTSTQSRAGLTCGQWPSLAIAKQATIVVDPVNIQVTRDDTDLSWWYDYECLSGPFQAHSMTWFLPTNWSRTTWYSGFPQVGFFDYPEPDYVEVINFSNYTNPGLFSWPPGFPLCTSSVWNSHSPNRIFGFDDGEAVFDAEITISGPLCIGLLDKVLIRDVI